MGRALDGEARMGGPDQLRPDSSQLARPLVKHRGAERERAATKAAAHPSTADQKM